MTPLIDDNKIKNLTSYKQVLIHSAGLLTNLLLFICISLTIKEYSMASIPYIRSFALLFAVSNFAELESYITFGAINPISDVKFTKLFSRPVNDLLEIYPVAVS